MNTKTICTLLTLALAACAPPADDSATSSATTTAAPSGLYVATAQPESARWIDDMNLHADGTFEATFGNGVSDLSGHAFTADGTYKVDAHASTITFHYAFVADTVDTYAYKAVPGGLSLEYESADDASDQAWFTMAHGSRPLALAFGSDWSATQSGPLVTGAPLLVTYAAARSSCPGSTSLVEAPVTMYLAVDGAVSTAQVVEMPVRAVAGTFRALTSVPQGHALSVWFALSSSDASGNTTCTGWDSNYDHNYDFEIVTE